MSTQVVFTGTAKNDLREIAVHLAKRSGSRELAVRFVRELQEQTAILAQFPESGAFPQDRMLKSSGFRFLTHKDYLLFYRYERAEGRVYIMAIFHGRRDYHPVMQQYLSRKLRINVEEDRSVLLHFWRHCTIQLEHSAKNIRRRPKMQLCGAA